MFDFEFQQIANHALNLVYPWITEFNNFTTINANHMIMLVVTVRFFKLGHVFTKLMFGHQITGNKQFQCIVHGSPAYSVFLIFHMDVEGLYIEMIVSGIDFF